MTKKTHYPWIVRTNRNQHATIPAPTFLRVVSAIAMIAPLLAVTFAYLGVEDALARAQSIVQCLQTTAFALAIALALRGLYRSELVFDLNAKRAIG
jgi:hypothetical protein